MTHDWREDADWALRDAWLSEMWTTVHEYNEHEPQPVRSDRNVQAKPREERFPCPFCQHKYGRRALPRHLATEHHATFEEVA